MSRELSAGCAGALTAAAARFSRHFLRLQLTPGGWFGLVFLLLFQLIGVFSSE